MRAYLAVVLGLAVLLHALPEWQLLWFPVLGMASAAAVVVGILRHRPRRELPWWLLATAMLVAAMVIAWWRSQVALQRDLAALSAIDLTLFVVFIPLAMAGLLQLVRINLVHRDRAGLVDTLIFAVGAGLLLWTFLIQPFATLPGLTFTQRVVAIGYPVTGVMILAVIIRLAGIVRRSPALALLMLGGLGQLATSTVFGLAELRPGIPALQLGSFFLIVFFAAWGAAGLHPTMRDLTEPHPPVPGQFSRVRLLTLAAAALLAPAILTVQVLIGGVWDGVVAAGLTATIILLVLARLIGALAVYRNAVTRERALRQAGAVLLGATTVEEISGAVAGAVASLLPPQTPHQVLVEPDTGTGGPGAAFEVPSGEVLSAKAVEPTLTARLGGPEAVLCHHLVVIDETGAQVRVGALYLGAPKRRLIGLRAASGVLANQAALALERLRLTAEVHRRANEEYFRTLVQNASEMIIILDGDDDTIRYASPSVARTLGVADVAGQDLFDVVQPEDRPAATELIAGLRRGAKRSARADWNLIGPLGQRLQAEVRCLDLRSEPTVAGVVLALRDVSEQRRLEAELSYRAFHDSLTGLPNRVRFQERLAAALARGGGMVGVLLLDLDDFKMVNDTMGHAVGDELLVRAARRLVGLLRPEDTAARLGGDEFGALVVGAGRLEDLEQVAQRAVSRFAEPFELGEVAVSCSATLGLATSAVTDDPHDLLRHADLALYVAKQSGKGQWRRYRPADHAGVLRRMELRSALSHAVATGSFELEYQPIVTLADGRTVGMEALVRWRHPERGAVAPAEFIDVAEETGLIVPIGGWVLTRAVADAAMWSAINGAAPYLSVNVSARQFRQPGFVATVRRTLDTMGLTPSRLVIEITESALMRDPVWAELIALRDLGVRVAIDDFGTGYSSLSYLRQLPVDIIKLEKSFLTTITSSASQLTVVEGILALADRLDLTVVAEGVDREVVREQLLRSGCRYGQGFLFARPMPMREALAWARHSAYPA